MRLIDADDLIEFEQRLREVSHEEHTAEDIIGLIRTAPTVYPESLDEPASLFYYPGSPCAACGRRRKRSCMKNDPEGKPETCARWMAWFCDTWPEVTRNWRKAQ